MKINLFFIDDEPQQNLWNIFSSIREIEFVSHKINDFHLYKYENNFIVFTKTLTSDYVKKILNKIQNYNLNTSCFFLPLNFKKNFASYKIKTIFYPINMLDLESKLLNFFSSTVFFYKNLCLLNDNNLVHIKNKKNIFLTEIESKILKLLFTKNFVLKKFINIQVLRQHPNVESKSLESHLYRIRKKILTLDSQIQIIPHDSQSIKIYLNTNLK